MSPLPSLTDPILRVLKGPSRFTVLFARLITAGGEGTWPEKRLTCSVAGEDRDTKRFSELPQRHQLLLRPRSPRQRQMHYVLHAIEGGGGMDSVEADSRMR